MKKFLLISTCILALTQQSHAQNATATANAPALRPGANPLSLDLAGNTRVGQPDVYASQTLNLGTIGNFITIPVTNGMATIGITTSGITSSGATVVFSGTVDSSTTLTTITLYSNANNPASSLTSDVTGAGDHLNVSPLQTIRATVTVAGTGSAVINSNTSVAPFSSPVAATGSNIIGYTSPAANTSNGATALAIVATASTNATLISTATHNVYGLQCFTTNTTLDRYVKIFSKATTPVPGTDTPLAVFDIPGATLAGGNPVTYDIPSVGILTSLGLGYAITTNPALLDATALSAADTFCTIEYK